MILWGKKAAGQGNIKCVASSQLRNPQTYVHVYLYLPHGSMGWCQLHVDGSGGYGKGDVLKRGCYEKEANLCLV